MSRMTIAEAMNWIQSNPNSLGMDYGNLVAAREGLRDNPDSIPHQQMRDASIDRVEAAAAQQEQEAFDSGEFGAAACDCEPGEPCCLRAVEVRDASSASRKIVWPIPENGPNKLFVIAKEGSGGRASGEVELETTDFEPCKAGRSNTPNLQTNGFYNSAASMPAGKEKRTVTTPFQMPAVGVPVLPTEFVQVIWLLTTLVNTSTYALSEAPSVVPVQCCEPSGTALKVVAIPHLKVSGSVTGEVSVTFMLSRLPTFAAELSGTASGEFGNQTITYTGKAESSVGQASPPSREGPHPNPVFSFINKVQSALSLLADEERAKPNASTIAGAVEQTTFGTESSLKLAFSVTMNAPKLELKGKSGSPNLELTVDPFGLSFGPTVTGTVDLLDLMLTRIPNGPRIREALASKGNVVSASAECSITLEGSGTVGLDVMNAAVIEIGSADGWESEFGALRTRFSGELKLTGTIKAAAQLDIRTWIFDASASASGEVSTGWQFGARVTENADGTQKWEELYHFQGITLKASVSVDAGSRVAQQSSNTTTNPGFGNAAATEATAGTSSSVTTDTELVGNSWEAKLMDPSGSDTHWREMT